ncbi:MAG: DNA-binding protein [Ignavibacteriales bacterium UTCHB2]|nr:MAG: DNA-binding protein [Ignavibacteriales bacterium UTCHB2]
MDTQIIEKLDKIESLFNQSIQKEVLNFSEATEFLNLSASYLYKLTSTQQIPHYKPNGKKVYFKRSELEAWLLKNRVKSIDELEQKAIDYVVSNKKGGVK